MDKLLNLNCNGASEFALGLDIGSTTAKAVLRRGDVVLFKKYERHNSAVKDKAVELVREMLGKFGNIDVCSAISGSAGLGLAQAANIGFTQEVFAEGEVVKRFEPDTACVIELGGEDAKIIFFDKNGGADERMNGSCAGGTGAFIDQMATLLGVSIDELDRLSLNAQRIYPIASRCGVFAKTDIQPLINQGARKEDIAAGIYKAVVNQTIAGLARGKRISGKVMFLGGPLFYLQGLKNCFKQTLELSDDNAVFPSYARFAVALGASFYAEKTCASAPLGSVLDALVNCSPIASTEKISPLFANSDEFDSFSLRHSADSVPRAALADYSGNIFIGIDCGSTTTKLVAIGENNQLLYTYYGGNLGNPVEVVRAKLTEIYALAPLCSVVASAVTGYGEELIKNAFSVDFGVVETIAHYTAAKFFRPNVDFILDIGGQDIKCFKINNGAIDSIMLNEACSSGCGSFLETFAKALGFSAAEFARLALFADNPVNLGSRCTVFMNSSVKQAQKDGATVADISAGLSMSVVKNALYKVIRVSSADNLGKNIVVQGGTFLNDAVLRAFERELGCNVIRPDIAGLMGAYGAALYARDRANVLNANSDGSPMVSSLASPQTLAKFVHTSRQTTCSGCANHCKLTVNSFGGDNKQVFISGNNCEKPLKVPSNNDKLPNLLAAKREYLTGLKPKFQHDKGYKIGLPLCLGMYELLPMWFAMFDKLGFDIELSPMTTRALYELGQFTIPSDTACYPAKIMHGHVLKLVRDGCDAVFYPCLPYNIIEQHADNHYNCPVVAYYPELLNGNVEELKNTDFLYPYLNINDSKELTKEIFGLLGARHGITKKEVANSVKYAISCFNDYKRFISDSGKAAVQYARDNGKRILILAGRPYHADSEICHNIDRIACSLGFAVVTEDSVCDLAKNADLDIQVLNQWTFHARLYRAAQFAIENPDVEFVQLVSFGCGVDAVTTDEVRRLLENGGKLYTQLKIDEITNLGSVKIRLRSLLGALEEREEKKRANT